ncbi:DUF3556 domain-containing protein [Mycolicibacillus trivialis]|uniref:DUF3556 domain-containing protein n=1 Tax=Mycolicibacillus trivialis TaxID=1798 RepID=A0A1X2EHG6_9MYCO|nr:DUF3556 domain-containing protein [Mycolicibacillus trivialis]ORX02384.1 hypothetical protein AWC30_12420 [Mycolicibacillus trivialis]
MGFLTPSEPPVGPAHYLTLPLRERVRIAAQDWLYEGFGTPKVLNLVYIAKMLGLYLALGIVITALTSSSVSVTDVGSWWANIVTYQKLAVWLMLLEVLGLGGAWGPLCGHFKPMTGGWRFWLRPGTIRLAPWPGMVPGTGGDTRTGGDVAGYLAVLAALVLPLATPAVDVAGFGGQQIVPGWAFLPVLVVMPLMGLRDKVIFLAGRSEQYLPIMLWAAVFGIAGDFVSMVVAFKIVIVCVWVAAGVSKFTEHFAMVVPPMISNSPAIPVKFLKRLQYRDAPHDLRPSRVAWLAAHLLGTTVEIAVPIVLLLTTNATVALIGAAVMVAFHVFITSTFPLAVPLEWNIFFGYAAINLWIGHDPAVFSIFRFEPAWLLIPMFVLAFFFPVLGELRPDLVSFLPGMRQYSGNWATGIWAMRPGVEERLNALPGTVRQVDQLVAMGYEPDQAEMMVQRVVGWRSLHGQGRGLLSVAWEHLDDIDARTVREGEVACNTITGWNFGDGHLHGETLIAALQKRLNFAPGDFVVIYAEGQPLFRKTQDYKVIDAALGVVERGTWRTADCVARQPWLPDGPVPLTVTWAAAGYTRKHTLTRAPEPAV